MTEKTRIAVRPSEELAAARRRAALAPTFAALFLGLVLVAGTGFAGSDLIHEAAHDARHALGFPCH